MTPNNGTDRDADTRARSYTWLVVLIFAAVIVGSAFLVFFVINP
jgi:hypothetical protein